MAAFAAPATPDRPRVDPVRLRQARAGENFPVGSWLLPRAVRVHFARLYAFARTADDLADEHHDAAALTALRADLLRHLEHGGGDPLLGPLCATLREFAIPVRLCTDLVDAFLQDLRQSRYGDLDELLAYCRRSADPVGRAVLRLWRHDDPALDARADAICTALQLVNHLRDVREDLVLRDRIYWPQDWLVAAGVTEAQLRAGAVTPGFLALVRRAGALCRDLFRAGWPLTTALRGLPAAELRAIVHGGCTVLERCLRAPAALLTAPPHLGRVDHAEILLRALCTRRPPRILAEALP